MTASSATDALDDGRPVGRDARLAAAVRALRTRTARLPAPDVLRLAGPFLVPLGALLVVLGWYGAAHTTHLYFQIPYLISGGLGGLGIMFVGGFAYFSRWITDLAAETRATSAQAVALAERTAATLDRIEELLRQAPAPTGRAASAPATARTEAFVATARGKLFHRPDCSMVAGRDVRELNGSAGDREPCRICLPELADPA